MKFRMIHVQGGMRLLYIDVHESKLYMGLCSFTSNFFIGMAELMGFSLEKEDKVEHSF